MKVIIYGRSANDPRFELVLKEFMKGVARSGDQVSYYEGIMYQPCDVAVFFGSWKNRDTPWHNVKNDIVAKANNFIVLETPLIGRGPVAEIMQDNWFRIGINGFLADTGNFNNNDCDGTRWSTLSTALGLSLTEYKKNPSLQDPVIIPLQLPGDASLRGACIEKWVYDAATEVRSVSDRPIVVRTPQLPRAFDKRHMSNIGKIPNLTFQEGTRDNLFRTLKSAHCTVVYSSGLSVDSLLMGCPTIACSRSNFCYDTVQNCPSSIECLYRPDRNQLFYNLSYAQWHVKEMAAGMPWKHLRSQL